MKNVVLIRLLLLMAPLALAGCGKSEKPQAPAEHAEDGEHAEGADGRAEGVNESHEGGIELTEAQIKSSGIQLLQAGPAKIRQTLPLYGAVAPNAERVREVTARYPGVVRSVSKRVGDSVREAETLATVESNESLRTYPLTAPLTGVVTMRKANPGEYTGENVLFTVADLSTVWVELALFPRHVAHVRVGQTVQVQSPDANLAAEGEVTYVAPFGQASNQSLTARVLLDNDERRWAPGLYVTAEVTLAESQVPLAISNAAVQTLEGRTVVFAKGDRGFEPRSVELGRSDNEFTEVLSGLNAGEVYVANNSFILKAEIGKGLAEHGH